MATKTKNKKGVKRIRVSAYKCVGCSYCKLNCPEEAMEVVSAIAHPTKNCTRCGTCIWVCPVGAITQK